MNCGSERFGRRLGLRAAVLACMLFSSAYCQSPNVALLVQVQPSSAGLTSPGAGVHYFTPNSEVSLRAAPGSGYQFVCWLGDVGDRTSYSTIAYLDRPKIIIAVFQPADYLVLPPPEGGFGGRPGGGPSGTGLGASPYPLLGGFPISGGSPRRGDVYIIPEPSTLLLLWLGAAYVRRRR